MSEYQFFDFLALDAPLTPQQREELRSWSSRASISRRRFTNSYHFGNPQFDPAHLVDEYFDLSLLLTNWGDREVQFAVPATTLTSAAASAYCSDTVTTVRDARGRTTVCVRISSDDVGAADEDPDDVWDAEPSVESYGDDGWEDEEGSQDGTLDVLVTARALLLDGDQRLLYLAWLVAVARGDVDDDVLEPPVPPGLRALGASLGTFADFMLLPSTLVEAAATASPRLSASRQGVSSPRRTAGQLLYAEALLT